MLGAGHDGRRRSPTCARRPASRSCSRTSSPRPRRARQGLLGEARRQGRRARPHDRRRRATRCWRASRRPTDAADAAGADLVIEAVFEDPAVKAQVFAEIEPHLADGALLGSNTSTLPITELAEGVSRPADFIGLHFFSPVDKMPLLEIIKGEQTSDETLYRALDVAKQIGKTPIVVNDSRGFFTSPRDRHVHQRGHRDAHRGRPGADDRAGLLAGRLPGARCCSSPTSSTWSCMRKIRKAPQGGGRGRGRRLGRRTRPTRSSTACSTSSGRPGKLRGAGLLRVRGRQAHAAVAGPAGGVPAGRRPVARSRSRTSRSGCCSPRRSRPSSASTRA